MDKAPGKKIKHAIAGLGRIASSLEEDIYREKPCTHAGAIKASGGVIIAGCDINEKKRSAFAKRWGASNLYDNCEEMLKNESVDILHIAAPPEAHFDLIKTACKYKIPVVVSEKPLTDNVETSKEALKITEMAQTKLIVNHERRYSNDYIYTKNVVKQKKYGEVQTIFAKLYFGSGRTPSSMLWDDGTHIIDILRFILDDELEVVNVINLSKKDIKGESLIINLKAGGAYALLEVGGAKNYTVFELEIYFNTGLIRIGNGLFEEYSSEPSKLYENFRSLKQVDKTFIKTDYFINMVKDASKVFRTSAQPVSSGYDGYRAVEIINNILNFNGDSL
ncbi:MAG TPA: Gfo/Idh/MocA family oxidoreductase [Spirochaetota bacterium]|jgi:predicted dehydrogenase|nr:MAG: putative 4,5-dihydroxyphthalate dehydrogenase [Spirochaetes bacterium ADurb.Bin133]HNZ26377.1 Gfo/Idh/MocA family oxidoreductase [Spirochaetota bacterium]HOF00016.1 Gfo/Idh/MocA family oxidoreductase [Spirochaetota bacterium]HOS32029.1 Gfo/Idh/MocA family oxidoreductase [Spirochaetota bacterium]HOS55013.1 Gfo/Idh/MocA family oxidoreductase [Spirochaetota bacterium]